MNQLTPSQRITKIGQQEMLGFIGLLIAALSSTPAYADITGKVVAIQDGDTLTVLDESNAQLRVRLTGIDAPEKRQAFGQRSKEALSDCAFGKAVVVVGDKFDRYKRLLGKVIADGEDCNLRQIRFGMAWHYKKYERTQLLGERGLYAREEVLAKESRTGLWKDEAPTPPWDFRLP